MDNIEVKVQGDKLMITVPNLKAAGRPSSTGKTMVIATTNGFMAVDHASGAKVMVNVTIPKK